LAYAAFDLRYGQGMTVPPDSTVGSPATDPTLWSTSRQSTAIAAKSLSARELFDAQLARIESLDPHINAICTMALETSREQATRADEATARGESWGALHGIAVTIKDAIETGGMVSTGGSTLLRKNVPLHDAPVVARIKSSGAIVFGKTNLPEWCGEWQAYNEMFGTTNNPWDLSRTPGGSSGGAAAAVATGMSSFEIGTDIGGSIRVPSAFCGVYGHKPSFGVIPTLGYLDEPGGGSVESDVNVFGPIARSAQDLRLLLDIMSGPTPDGQVAWRLDLPEPATRNITGLRGLRIGVWFDEPALRSDPTMLEVLNSLISPLEDAGAQIDATSRPAFDFAPTLQAGLQLISAACGVSDNDPQPTHTEWLFAHRKRAEIRAKWASFFESVDVLLCPVSVTPAIPHLQGGSIAERSMVVGGQQVPYFLIGAWASFIGSAYLPSTATPIGQTASGLPVGVQVVSPYLHDYSSIAVSGWITELTGGYQPPPLQPLKIK
jgi:amidase